LLGDGESSNRLRDVEMTTNDLELNQLLVRTAALHPIVSEYVRQGHMRSAAFKASELHEIVRKLDWRIQELLTEKESK